MRVNEQIRIPKVLVIDENGQKLGVMDTRDAIRLARSKGLDLIEVAPNVRPPVCRIMDYGKLKYQQQKRAKEARKHQKEMKEIRLSPQISEHDLLYRVKNAEEFLQEGHRVRLFMQATGRWLSHMDLGEAKLRDFINRLSHIATVEMPPTYQGKILVAVLAPRKDTKLKPASETAKAQPQTTKTDQSQQRSQNLAHQQQISDELKQPALEQNRPEEPKVIEVSSGK
ncbi:MAG: translation initiation factor IF-3 [Armatimonadetes bacterium]|nr:translation initiation factor IF-3 [Armatimonadota bacterium]MDW8027756.1 translation initiation factor IF-3 [Armatimonadota bacterium]